VAASLGSGIAMPRPVRETKGPSGRKVIFMAKGGGGRMRSGLK